MLNRYYEQELANLRDLAVEFSRANPALAPMLSGPSSDPDVERLLEGVAFLTGLVRQKLDDELPEFVQELTDLLFPHYLRPIPPATIVVFGPKGKLNETLVVEAGTEVGSVPVDGTSCVFRTGYRVEVHPLEFQGAALVQQPGATPRVRLSFETRGIDLTQWRASSLRLHLGGPLSEASKLYLLLTRHLREIVVGAPGAEQQLLDASALKPVGFGAEEALMPYPPHAYPGYRLLREFFALPEKFLFLDLHGLERWENRGAGTRFTAEFLLTAVPDWMPELRHDSFILFATPAVNLFKFDADPVVLDHRRDEYRVRPSAANKAHYQVYSVDRVVGYRQGAARERTYTPFGLFREADAVEGGIFKIVMKPSATSRATELHLSVPYAAGALPEEETLSIQLTCTNGSLAESLRLGDICNATSTSPERLEFRNIRPPTPYVVPPGGEALLWRLLSHISLNYLSLATAENLRALLHLYLFSERSERGADAANRKRIEGVQEVTAEAASRLVEGIMMRGRNIRIKCRQDNFAGIGDLYLFACMLDQFLGCYAGINAYTRLEVEDALSGERFQWPERLGQQPLI
ncbi:MAG: type VI secretion system baseplate subunit TssF [Betaproteobacteria bacterium]|nr:type VI secretion system baseplate subunit TssF [Betaproteobacteria bacterium]